MKHHDDDIKWLCHCNHEWGLIWVTIVSRANLYICTGIYYRIIGICTRITPTMNHGDYAPLIAAANGYHSAQPTQSTHVWHLIITTAASICPNIRSKWQKKWWFGIEQGSKYNEQALEGLKLFLWFSVYFFSDMIRYLLRFESIPICSDVKRMACFYIFGWSW